MGSKSRRVDLSIVKVVERVTAVKKRSGKTLDLGRFRDEYRHIYQLASGTHRALQCKVQYLDINASRVLDGSVITCSLANPKW